MRVLLVSIVVVILDQVSKFLVRYFLNPHESVAFLGNFVRLTFIENQGMAFGFQFGGQAFYTIFSTIATAVIVVFIFRVRHERLPIRLALALILGGAVGNLIDRFMYAKVTDFIDVGIGSLRWEYIFNVADSAVTTGVAILLVVMLLESKKARDEEIHPERELSG